jgi:hypothetical protein
VHTALPLPLADQRENHQTVATASARVRIIEPAMSAVDSQSPARNNGHGGLTPGHDDTVNQYLTAANTGDHYIPLSQPDIMFTTEPGSIMEYSNYGGEGQGYEADTSTIGGSYSSQHPNNTVSSYQYQNGYLQHGGMAAATAAMNNTLSPSAHSMNDQFGSESYMSDSNHDYSRFASPMDDQQMLGDQFGSMLQLGDAYPQGQLGEYDALTASNLAINANLPPNFTASQAQMASSNHSGAPMLSPPTLTGNANGSVPDGSSHSAKTSQASSIEREPFPKITTSMIGNVSQQQSPALTPNSGYAKPTVPSQNAPHLMSPIVTVEDTCKEESPTHSDISRSVSKRSHGSKRSAYLSPHAAEESSGDEEGGEEERQRGGSRTVVTDRLPSPTQERNEDGSWKVAGQAGLSPVDRSKLNDVEIPSLNEQDEAMIMAEKKQDVEDWLSHSDVGSESELNPNASSRKKRSMKSRIRAHSTGNMRPRINTGFGLGVQMYDRFDDSNIPGPGALVEERSEFDEDEWGSKSGSEQSEEEPQDPPSPPAGIEITQSGTAATGEHEAASNGSVPPTANAAMMRFVLRARENDTASVTATIGSRRRSESELGSLFHANAVSKAITPETQRAKPKQQRRPSFLERLLPERGSSKRKGAPTNGPSQGGSGQASPKEASSTATLPKRTSSWGRAVPRVDTNMSISSKDGASGNVARPTTPSGPFSAVKKTIQRARSKSDLGKVQGLAQLMTQHGGPPMPFLASPLADPDASKLSPPPPTTAISNNNDADSDADEDMAQEAIIMDLKVRHDPIIPTYDGFKTHARQLNPRLVDYMVERITQEQMRRYKRLLEFRVKHANAIKNKNCGSGTKFCVALGGASKPLPPRAGQKEGEAPFMGFQVIAPGSEEEEHDGSNEGTVVSAQFPPGVPLPPVKRLPAEFECPLCFKVKKFYKPSDWTKHVHEDVQPFTCTFPNCGEPKSFKRKADWVRHENERHRQLENWTCTISDCNHTCYRKDNFVQHLVREHKLPEPRARSGRREAEGGSVWQNNPGGKQDPSDEVWALVERCRHDTTKLPKDEPCRFCGNICNSWKKLTVHLAKHMEQISMPILPLVEQKQISADTIISPIEFPQTEMSTTPVRSPINNPSRYDPSTNGPSGFSAVQGLDPNYVAKYSRGPSPSPLSSGVMHTYPPPNFAYGAQGGPNAEYSGHGESSTAGYMQSYPPVTQPPKAPRGTYMDGLQIPSHTVRPGSGGGGSPQTQTQGARYPITPVSAYLDSQPQVFSSPVDHAYSHDTYANVGIFSPPTPQQTSGDSMPAFTEINYGQAQYGQQSGYGAVNYMHQQQQQNQYGYGGGQ